MNNERGQALLVALLALAAGVLIVAPFLSHASSSLTGSRVYGQVITEQYSADAGVEYAIWHLQSGESEVPEGGELQLPEFTINTKTVNVTMENEGEQIYQITSTATSEDGSSTTVESYISITMGFFDDDFTVFEGGLTQGQGDEYTGNVYAEGNVQLERGAVINGNVFAEGNVQLDQEATINGNVIAQGNVQLDRDAVIDGDVCAGENAQLDQGAVINGNVYAVGNVQLDQNATIDGDVYAGGDVQLDQGATITGDYPLPYEGCPLFVFGDIDVPTWEIILQTEECPLCLLGGIDILTWEIMRQQS